MIKIWFDGACTPRNPGGIATFGFVIKTDKKYLHHDHGITGLPPETSCNLAEYAGLRAALIWLIQYNLTKEIIQIYGDSNLVINQMFGTWRIKNGIYSEIALETEKILKSFPYINGSWIPREQNSEADELSKRPLFLNGIDETLIHLTE